MPLPPAWHAIHGWFDYASVYDEAVERAADRSQFVEVGSWQGKSLIYLAQRIKESGKRIAIYAVDTFEGDSGVQPKIDELHRQGKTLFEVFDANLRACGFKDSIRVLRMESTIAAALFPPSSLDFVFIDADHAYERVQADIAAWRTRVRVGGTLAGHDWKLDGVRHAVVEVFGRDRIEFGGLTEGPCWMVRIE